MTIARPHVDRLTGYTPGEQPQESGWIKLNTNENPYRPSPRVIEAIEKAARDRLNVYPDPVGTTFREAVGCLFDIDADWVLPANGSDENLTILLRTFVDPGEEVSFPFPSYILYETLAELQGASHSRLILNDDWSWNVDKVRGAIDRSKLVFVPNPNSPSGNQWSDETIKSLIPSGGLLVLDEAYGDFADNPHRIELLQGDHGSRIVVTRTLSKSYSLAGLRLGFAIARPEHVAQMRKVKDSYNCDSLALAAGVAAIEDQDWMLQNTRRIRETRAFLTEELQTLGFDVTPSQANFVWCRHRARSSSGLYEQLKSERILVRYMTFEHDREDSDGQVMPRVDGLRITVGSVEEIGRLLEVLRAIV